MRLQTQDYIGAQKIQQELSRVIPQDKTIAGLALLLPEEVRAQKLAEQDYDDEYDEEDDYGQYGEEDYGEDDDYVEESQAAETQPLSAEENLEKIKKVMDAEDENQVQEDDEDSYDSYDPEEYDDNGNYIWGKEGDDWEFYYEEDKIAFEKGESTVSNCLNPEMLPQKGTAIGDYYAKSTAVTAEGTVIRASYAKDGAFYVTRKKAKTTDGTKPMLLTE